MRSIFKLSDGMIATFRFCCEKMVATIIFSSSQNTALAVIVLLSVVQCLAFFHSQAEDTLNLVHARIELLILGPPADLFLYSKFFFSR